MSFMKSFGLLLLASGLVGCSTVEPISRKQLAANIKPILKIEERIDQMRYYTKMLDSLGGISKEKLAELKGHYDVYYVYYLASNLYLAEGNTVSYLANVKQAQSELDAIEAILKDGLAKEWNQDSGEKDSLSQLNL
jgi:hypothetical protein